jgi:enamine deaminase RidA (YjgF/YER057c/UK114 family)
MRKQVIYTEKLMRPIAHFSHAVRVGQMIYVGATAGTDHALQLAGTRVGYVDAMAQTRKMLDNLETVLGLLGGKLDDLVQVKTYLADPRDIAAAREINIARLGAPGPVQAFVGSHAFPLPQAAIELDAIAVLGGARQHYASSARHNEALRTGNRFYATAAPAPGQDGQPADLDRQIEMAFASLGDLLSRAGMGVADLVHLHVTLSHVSDAAEFRDRASKVLGESAVAITIVIAPPPETAIRVQIEAFALTGGGQYLASGNGRDRAAVLAGNEIYFSGQLGQRQDGRLPGGAERQIDAAWSYVEVLLEASKCSPENVLRTNNILTDWRDYVSFNRGYAKHVARPYPPRTTVLAALENPEARAQIEGIAYCGTEDVTIVDVRPVE